MFHLDVSGRRRDGGVDVHDAVLRVGAAADRARLGIGRGEPAGGRPLSAVHLQARGDES